MVELRKVTALIDWDTARRIETRRISKNSRHDDIFEKLRFTIAEYISAKDPKNRYRVTWRIYHGWHQGKTKTVDRRLFDDFARRSKPENIRSVSFSADFGFSENPVYLSPRIPIFDTLRRHPEKQELRQKMVDTILVCDLLHLVRFKEADLYIVIGSDDDLIPALYLAEAWKANVVMLHNREFSNSHLQLKGICARMKLT